MNTYLFKNFKIEVDNDPPDFNTASCLKRYAQDSEDTVPVSKHGIKVCKEQAVVNSCILIKWCFSGADIFVSHNGSDSFQLSDSSIQLTDFNENHYELDFDGKIVKPA